MFEVAINKSEDTAQIGVYQKDKLIEYYEIKNDEEIGNVFEAEVYNTLPTQKRAFLKCGDKKYLLHYKDLEENRKLTKKEKILVQLKKKTEETKYDIVSEKIEFSIGGITILSNKEIEISKKIDEKIKKDLNKLIKKSKFGFKIKEDLSSEYKSIIEELETKMEKVKRDRKLKKDYLEELKNRLGEYKIITREIIYKEKRKINMDNGGELVFDKTEAMNVIDVNSGKYMKTDDFLEFNKMAADKILKEIRIRNLSGIIIVDFINMRKNEQEELFEYIKKRSKEYFLDIYVHGFTRLGLLEITRKRII